MNLEQFRPAVDCFIAKAEQDTRLGYDVVGEEFLRDAAKRAEEGKRLRALIDAAAPGIDLTSLVPAEREKPELMLATWHEVAGWNACVAEIRRRIDAVPKGGDVRNGRKKHDGPCWRQSDSDCGC